MYLSFYNLPLNKISVGVNLKLDFFDKSPAQMHKNTKLIKVMEVTEWHNKKKLILLWLKFSTTMKKILKRVIV
jgi:hypothetical protein